MARPRKQKAPPSRAGKRDYKAEYAWRVRHVPAGERSLARGHRGQTRQFLRAIKPGDLIFCDIRSVESKLVSTGRRDKRGRILRVRKFPLIVKEVIPATGGDSREYRLRNLTVAELRATIRQEEKVGVVFSPVSYMDQRQILKENRP